MPAISKIRLTNVIYESGDKRFNDELFTLEGNNTAILLENGGGKTVLIHTVLQAVLPHTALGERKIKETLQIENSPAHIAIEWIINENPRRYLVTAVTLFLVKNELKSYKYVFEYEAGHPDRIEEMQFVQSTDTGNRVSYKEEINDYYNAMKAKTHNAKTFDTIQRFHHYLEENYQIITDEWKSIVTINQDEGGIEQFFENCKTTTDLYDRLLIPTVENSIVGHEENMFADMFEKQREGFQMYRKLQQSMKEHQAIQDELKSYVKEYEQYAAKETAYVIEKQAAKGLIETLKEQEATMQETLAQHEIAWSEWEVEKQDVQMKKASFAILQAEIIEDEAKRIDLEKTTAYEAAQQKFEENEHVLYSLEYAQNRQEQTASKQALAQYKKELAEQDEASEATDVEHDLAEARGKLHGIFAGNLEELTTLEDRATRDMNPIKDKLSELELAQKEKTTKLKQEETEVNRIDGQLKEMKRQQDRLEKELLVDPEQEKVADLYAVWQKQSVSLDEKIIQQKELKRTTTLRKTEQTEVVKENREQLQKITNQLTEKNTNRTQLQDAHNTLLEQLAFVRPSWHMTKDVYLKVGTITSTLDNELDKLSKERDGLLHKERIAHRFVDDYDTQEDFFADPYIEKRYHDWKNQFFVETGVRYVADTGANLAEAIKEKVLWPLTLLTTETDKPLLLQKLTEGRNQLQYPIHVMTLEETRSLTVDNASEQNWIAPEHWTNNMDETSFTEWKAHMYEYANEATKKRQEKEDELATWRRVQEYFSDFLVQYPAEWKETLLEEIRELEQEKATYLQDISEIESLLEQMVRELQAIDENVTTNENKKAGYERRIEQAKTYLQTEREMKQLSILEKSHQTTLEQVARELKQLGRDYDYFIEEKHELKENIRRYQYEREKITENKEYKQVRSYRIIKTNEAQAVIESIIESLNDKLKGIQNSYQNLKTKLENEQKHIERLEAQCNVLLDRYPTLDTTLSFPIDGEFTLEKARKDVIPLQENIKQQEKVKDNARKTYTEASTKLTGILADFADTFEEQEPVEFADEVDIIEKELQNLEQQLVERKNFLQTELDRTNKELTDITNATRTLEQYSIAHHLMSTTLTATYLTEKELTDFIYSRSKHVQEKINALEKTKKTLDEAKQNIYRVQQRFRNFCRDHVTERKLREMAITGIEQQQTYEDVLRFQNNMMTTIERADQYARINIANQDKEVQAFINSIHNHLLNVVEQLSIIPKQTRVKVGEKWREIYRFSIPEWQVEEGKSRIHSHMDWILEQLETDNFKDDQGTEDTGKVRKHVETWLDTKQLLQIVMNNDVMKVTCRKVTNDNQVTSRLTSWEQSQKWSGGEKWSKNMTLYLGILNFIAEKKQYNHQKMKRSRAVILDNPFGKASSDHVLSPVFFIAEQLGFQMIALTAHADGKFLQDFFPIIYSMKLRSSTEQGKQVMTKEKQLHKAYFRDHEPEQMDRLEEKEQLELF